MTKTSFFIFTSILISTGFGLSLMVYLLRLPQEKSASSNITPLLYDGLLTLCKRMLSSVIQATFYTILALNMFAFIFHQHLDWHQMAAFIIGSIIMTFALVLNMLFTPNMVPKIISASKGYLEPGFKRQYDTVNAISFTTFGFSIIGFLSCKLWLGTYTIIGYALGITFASFFIRISSGLFKSSADISADSIALQTNKIPSNHPSNPANLLDIIGTFISALVGFSSDILGSFIFVLTACSLSVYTLYSNHIINENTATKLGSLPLFTIATSMLAAIAVYVIGSYRIKTQKHHNVLLEGLYISIAICGIATAIKSPSKLAFLSYSIGLIGAVMISLISEYLTSFRHSPTRNVAKEAEKGTTISIFNTFISGLLSNSIYLTLLLCILIPAYMLLGVFGIIMASFGMLSVTSTMMMITLFAPLSSITYKINTLTESKEGYKNTRRMDKIGQTTIALGKGFAAGTATLSTISLLLSIFMVITPNISYLLVFQTQDLAGFLIGIMIPLIFCGLLLLSLKKLILKTQTEVLRQYEEIPFLLENKAKPDITKLANANAKASNDALIIPGILMAFTPIILAFFFKKSMLIGFTLSTALSCIGLNFFFATLGDTANNAKSYIQNGHFGGSDSPTFTHIQITDSVGDAFKDLLAPGINILMKSIAILAGLLLLILK